MTALRFRDMIRRKEFFVISLLSCLILLVPVLLDLLLLHKDDLSNLRPAWYYFGLSLSSGMTYYTPVTMQFAFMMLVPLLCSMAYSYCVFDETRYGAKALLVTRAGKPAYYLSSAIAVFLGGFLIIFIPLVLSQLVFLLAIPASACAPYSLANPITSDIDFSDIHFFASLANNHHYLYNLLYSLIPAFVCALVGLLSFSLSLFYKKNKFLIVSLPFFLYVMSMMLFSLFKKDSWVLSDLIMPNFYSRQVFYLHTLLFEVFILLLLNLGALTYKIRFSKDEMA